MATILDKDITRESTVKYDNREIQITLTEDQQISFKLKGMKSGILSIGIEELYKQLVGDDAVEEVKPTKVNKPVTFQTKQRSGDYDGGPMVPLGRLRSMLLVDKMELPMKMKIEENLSELLKQNIQL